MSTPWKNIPSSKLKRSINRSLPTSSRETIAADAPAVLGLEEIRHEYGEVTAIDLLSLSVAEGEVVCLLGPSGCGKTTALRIAAGLGGVWRVFSWARFVPRPIRDGLYYLVQKSRYQVFGKRETCRLPTAEEQSRFLP